MGLSPARVGVGGAARKSVFRSSVRAVSRIEVPRPERTRQAETNPTAGVRELRTETPGVPKTSPGCRGVISNYRGARKCGFGAKSGPKGAFCSRRAQQGKLQRDGYRHLTRLSTCTIFLRRTAAGGLEDNHRRRVRYLQRNLSVHLYRFPRQTGAGILDAQSCLKAYLGVQNHTTGGVPRVEPHSKRKSSVKSQRR